MIKIYVKGVFDLVHYGHINFLREARTLGDWLTVGVTPDERVISMKRKPLFNVQRRAEVIAAVRYVDEVFIDGPRELTIDFMQEHNFDLYIFGTQNPNERAVRLYDCRNLPNNMIVEIPYTYGVSTTEILQTIKNY
jgi:cytidyltransferase-like protein